MNSLGLILLLISSLASGSLLLNKTEKEHFSSLRCKEAVSNQLNQWESNSNWTKHFVGAKTVKFISPTRKFSKWVEVYFGDINNTMRLVTPSDVLTVEFNKKCEKSVSLKKVTKVPQENSIDDEKLHELLQKNQQGVIYTFGPEMPLSIDGIKEIRKATKQRGLKLTLILPSARSMDDLKKQLSKKKITVDEFIVSDSIELALRGAFLHLPSIITYNAAKLDRRARPGHEIASLYARYIKKKLGVK